VAGTKAEGGAVDRRRGQHGVVGGYLERVTCFRSAAFERWVELEIRRRRLKP
jgi:hypothetical protein